MRAIVYDRPREFSVREIADPTPGSEDVLVRVLLAGVCGTDLHIHEGEFGPSYPLVPGHEFVGEIIEVGADISEPTVGQRVVVDNTSACGRCVECRRARPAFCRNLVAQGVNAPGGFAELVVVPAAKCFVVDDLAPEVAVLAEPTACVLHGLDVLAAGPGSEVLLFGAGTTGILLAQLLKGNGAGRLTVAAPSQHKLDLVAARGADVTYRLDRTDPAGNSRELRKLAGDGFDVVIDATGAPSVLDLAIPLTRTGGTVFVYGMTPESNRWGVSSYEIFRRELTIKGSFAQQFSFDRSVAALRAGQVSTEGFVTRRFGLDDYADALAAVAGSADIKVVLVPGA